MVTHELYFQWTMCAFSMVQWQFFTPSLMLCNDFTVIFTLTYDANLFVAQDTFETAMWYFCLHLLAMRVIVSKCLLHHRLWYTSCLLWPLANTTTYSISIVVSPFCSWKSNSAKSIASGKLVKSLRHRCKNSLQLWNLEIYVWDGRQLNQHCVNFFGKGLRGMNACLCEVQHSWFKYVWVCAWYVPKVR